MPTNRPPATVLKAQYESVLNEVNSLACSTITDKITEFEQVARSLGRRTRYMHEAVVSIWNKDRNPDKVCALLDKKISQHRQEAERRLAEGKSLIQPYSHGTSRYRALAIEFLLRHYSEEDLRTYRSRYYSEEDRSRKICPLICTRVFEYCDNEFLVQYPGFFTGSGSLKDETTELKKFRNNNGQLRIKILIDNALEALLKQGPRDSSSSQTGDLPTPSCHGLGLLARAASDAEKRANAEKRDSSNLDQLLRAMRSNVPDSVTVPVNCGSNDGRGECSEDEVRLTRPLSATGGSRVASRATADACAAAGAAASGGGVGAAAAGAAGGGAKAFRPRNAPKSSVTAPPALTQAESKSCRRRRRRRRPSRSHAESESRGEEHVSEGGWNLQVM
jgi:hypothetical protein